MGASAGVVLALKGRRSVGPAAVRCPCGALGCWGTAVDGTALARRLGMPPPRDQVTYTAAPAALAALESSYVAGLMSFRRVAQKPNGSL